MSDLIAKARSINAMIDEANVRAYSALEKAAEIGAELLDVKDELPHGKFSDWVETNIPVGIRQCQKYMKIARQGLPDKSDADSYFRIPSSIDDYIRNPKKKPEPEKGINDVARDISKEAVGFSHPVKKFYKKTSAVINHQDQVDEAYLWEMKKNLKSSAKRLLDLAEQVDVTDNSFKEQIKENEHIIDADLWTGEPISFSDLPDEPDTDSLEEALEEAGLPPMPKDGKMPSLNQAIVNKVDKVVLKDFTSAQKRRVRKHIKEEIKIGIRKEVDEAVREERQQLNNLISEYGGRIEGSKEDVRTILASLHPDRPDRTHLQLTKSMQAFQRLIGEMK